MGEVKKKLLILTFYYQPDLCAGSFRSTALVKAIKKIGGKDISITVFTTRPNRYHSFSTSAPEVERQTGLYIKRFNLPKHKGGFIDQSRAFLSFARQAIREAEREKFDLIYATSSRLMTAALGAYLSRKKEITLYLDIRDIFVDTIKDIVSPWISWVMAFIFPIIERYAISQAQRVNLVSPGFEEYFKNRYPGIEFSFYTNGIDSEFIELTNGENIRMISRKDNKRVVILYAGNLGEGQGMHTIVPQLAQKMPSALFKIIGEGARRELLERKIKTLNVNNVVIIPPMTRSELIKQYLKADVLFLHLNNYRAFHKVLPSKIFEYAAMGKPIWAGVAGYPANFIKKELQNAAVFFPGNVDEALSVFKTLKFEHTPRTSFVKHYRRDKIMLEMAQDIIEL